MSNIYNNQIKINFENNDFFSFNYTYNNKTSFEDLLDYIAKLLPNKNICPCFSFQCLDKDNNNDQYYNISNDYKIYTYQKYLNYLKLLNNNDKICHCNFIIKDNYTKTKNEIFKYFSDIINTLNNKIIHKKNKIKILKKKCNHYEKKIYLLEREKEDLIEINDKQNKKVNDLINNINKSYKVKKEKFNNINIKEKEKLNKEKINNNFTSSSDNNNIIKNEEKLDDSYDIMINADSINSLCKKGWEIKINEKAKKIYENFKNDKIAKIGIIGGIKAGKSTLLSLLLEKKNIELNSDSKGLFIRYPKSYNSTKNKIIIYDYPGFETPLLNEENENEENGNLNNIKILNDKIKDKIMTYFFIQNYIIHNSDLLIMIVGNLTFKVQILINKIKKEISKGFTDRPLFIIHNLSSYSSIQEVKKYINDILFKNAFFKIKDMKYIFSDRDNKNDIYFYEENNQQKIIHLILAQDHTEAGDYYNDFTFNILKQSFQFIQNLSNFDLIETIKDRFIKISKDILELNGRILTKDDFDNSDDNFIKLKTPDKLIFKKLFIDELDLFNIKSQPNNIDIRYNYYKKDNKLLIKLEIPGNFDISSNIKYINAFTLIELSGNKKKDNEPNNIEDNIINNREFGDFKLEFYFKTQDYLIKNEETKISLKNGIITLEYTLDSTKDNVYQFKNDEN